MMNCDGNNNKCAVDHYVVMELPSSEQKDLAGHAKCYTDRNAGASSDNLFDNLVGEDCDKYKGSFTDMECADGGHWDFLDVCNPDNGDPYRFRCVPHEQSQIKYPAGILPEIAEKKADAFKKITNSGDVGMSMWMNADVLMDVATVMRYYYSFSCSSS